MNLPSIPEKFTVSSLRAMMGIIFISHGLARLYYWSVADFGSFLNAQGLMIGLALAWVITIGEILCGSLLAFGIKVKYCVIFHSIVIIGGIFLVHVPNGWFVVGHGQGGVEYSLLILTVLAVLYSRSN